MEVVREVAAFLAEQKLQSRINKMAMRVVWNDQTIVEIINFYRHHECLWNIRHVNYKNTKLKDALVQELGQRLAIPDEEVRKKWNNLRTQFNKEFAKATESEASGSSREELYIPKWQYYEALTFLKDGKRNWKMCTSLSYDAADSDDATAFLEASLLGIGGEDAKNAADSNDDADAQELQEQGMMVCQQDYTRPSYQVRNKQVCHQGRKRRKLDNADISAAQTLSAISTGFVGKHPNPVPVPDAFIVFGQHVAEELRQIKDPQMLALTKFKINEVIFQAHYGMYPLPAHHSPSSSSSGSPSFSDLPCL